jgi:hypothetical protein
VVLHTGTGVVLHTGAEVVLQTGTGVVLHTGTGIVFHAGTGMILHIGTGLVLHSGIGKYVFLHTIGKNLTVTILLQYSCAMEKNNRNTFLKHEWTNVTEGGIVTGLIM